MSYNQDNINSLFKMILKAEEKFTQVACSYKLIPTPSESATNEYISHQFRLSAYYDVLIELKLMKEYQLFKILN